MNRPTVFRITRWVIVALVTVTAAMLIAPAASAQQVYTLATIVNADAVNVRSGPGENFPVVRGLARGQQVGLVGRNADGSWVQLQGGAEWVKASFVQPYDNYNLANLPVTSGGSAPQPQPPSASLVLATVVNTDRLNVRSGPGPNYRAIRGLVFGQQVALVGRNADGSWVQLQTDGGRQEWVNARYVSAYGGYNLMNLPVTSDTTPDAPPPSSTLIVANVVNANRLNARSGPGESFPVVRQIPRGQEVRLVGRTIDSSWVQLEGGAGWVFSRFVQTQGNANLMSLPATANLPPSSPGTSVRVHVVQAGDTLSSIARRYGTTVSALVALNNLPSANTIYVGQRLIVSGGSGTTPPPSGRVHVVQAGETLARIAARYGLSWRTLAAANGITNPNVIYVGQRLVIP